MEENSAEKRIRKRISRANTELIIIFLLVAICAVMVYLIFEIPELIKKEPKNMLEVVEEGLYDNEVYDDEYAELDVEMLTDRIAYSTDEDNITEDYYIAFDSEGYPYIVRLTVNEFLKLEQINDYTYGEIEEKPHSVVISGITKKIPDELKEIVITGYNELYQEEIVSEENFENYFGSIYLDTGKGPYDLYEGICCMIICLSIGFIIILFINYMTKSYTTKKTIKKLKKTNELNNVYDEMDATDSLNFNKINTVLTRNYLVDFVEGFDVLKYEQIKWIYIYKHSINFAEVERAIVIKTKEFKQHKIAKIKPSKNKNDEQEKIFNELVKRCPNALVGFTKENKKEFKEYKKKIKIGELV